MYNSPIHIQSLQRQHTVATQHKCTRTLTFEIFFFSLSHSPLSHTNAVCQNLCMYVCICRALPCELDIRYTNTNSDIRLMQMLTRQCPSKCTIQSRCMRIFFSYMRLFFSKASALVDVQFEVLE